MQNPEDSSTEGVPTDPDGPVEHPRRPSESYEDSKDSFSEPLPHVGASGVENVAVDNEVLGESGMQEGQQQQKEVEEEEEEEESLSPRSAATFKSFSIVDPSNGERSEGSEQDWSEGEDGGQSWSVEAAEGSGAHEEKAGERRKRGLDELVEEEVDGSGQAEVGGVRSLMEGSEGGDSRLTRRRSVKRKSEDVTREGVEGGGRRELERKTSSRLSERSRTVTFTPTEDLSPRPIVSSERLRTLSNTMAPPNMPYLDSGEDWESEEDARSSRSGRNSGAMRSRLMLPQTTSVESEEGSEGERDNNTAVNLGQSPSMVALDSDTAQELEILSADLSGVIHHLKDAWGNCMDLETELGEAQKKYAEVNQLAESGNGAHTGEAELLFTILDGISTRKASVEEAMKTSLLLARQALAHSNSGAQRLARDSMDLQETVSALETELNSKNIELMEAGKSLKTMNEDKEELHEAVEHLRQLLQCSDSELEALREENEELQQQVFVQGNELTDFQMGYTSGEGVKLAGEEEAETDQENASILSLLGTEASEDEAEEIDEGKIVESGGGEDDELGHPSSQADVSQGTGDADIGSSDGKTLHVESHQYPEDTQLRDFEHLVVPSQNNASYSTDAAVEDKCDAESVGNAGQKEDGVHLSIMIQPSQSEFDASNMRLEKAEMEKQQLSDALQEASNKYLEMIEHLQVETEEWEETRKQVKALESENEELRQMMEEFDTKCRESMGLRAELKQQETLNEHVLANHSVLAERLDELSERLKSREAHMGDTLDAAREVGRENLGLQERIVELEKIIFSEQTEKDRLEGELRQLLERISEKESVAWARHTFPMDAKTAAYSLQLTEASSHPRVGIQEEDTIQEQQVEIAGRQRCLPKDEANNQKGDAALQSSEHKAAEKVVLPEVPKSSPNNQSPILHGGIQCDSSSTAIAGVQAIQDNQDSVNDAQIREVNCTSDKEATETDGASTKGLIKNFIRRFSGGSTKTAEKEPIEDKFGASVTEIVDRASKESISMGGAQNIPGPTKTHPTLSHKSTGTQNVPKDSDSGICQNSQSEILELLRVRLEQVDTERKDDANNAHLKLSNERKSRQKAEHLLQEGSQLMQCLVTTIGLCLREAKAHDGSALQSASGREKDMIDDVIKMVGDLEMQQQDQTRRPHAPYHNLLGPLERGMGPAQLE